MADTIRLLYPGEAEILDEHADRLDAAARRMLEEREGRTHRNGSDTEIAASLRVSPRTGTQRGLILDALAANPAGLTFDEIAALPGVADTAHRTRTSELVAGGFVVDSGRRRANRRGNDEIVWIPVI